MYSDVLTTIFLYKSGLCVLFHFMFREVWVSAYNQILSESFIIFRVTTISFFFLILMYVRDGVKAFFHRLRTVDIHTQITTE